MCVPFSDLVFQLFLLDLLVATPRKIDNLPPAKLIACSLDHAAAYCYAPPAASAVYGWGVWGEPLTPRFVPVPTELPVALQQEPVERLACTATTCHVVSESGRLYSWGDGVQLGLGSMRTSLSSTPTEVRTLVWVQQISASASHVLALARKANMDPAPAPRVVILQTATRARSRKLRGVGRGRGAIRAVGAGHARGAARGRGAGRARAAVEVDRGRGPIAGRAIARDERSDEFEAMHRDDEEKEEDDDGEGEGKEEEEEEEEETFEVERICDKRLHQGEWEYLVKWKDYDDPSWEPATSCTGCPDLIRDFELAAATTVRKRHQSSPLSKSKKTRSYAATQPKKESSSEQEDDAGSGMRSGRGRAQSFSVVTNSRQLRLLVSTCIYLIVICICTHARNYNHRAHSTHMRARSHTCQFAFTCMKFYSFFNFFLLLFINSFFFCFLSRL